jgi:putative membrane protein
MMYWRGDGGWMWVGGVIMIVFLVLIIALIIWGVSRMSRGGMGMGMGMHHMGGGPDPLSIAKERYAKGEINQEEFEKIKKNLA